MSTHSSDTQVRAYAGLRRLEGYTHDLEDLIGSLKRRCLHGGGADVEAFAALATEMFTRVRQLSEQAAEFEKLVGSVKNDDPMLERRRAEREVAGLRGSTEAISVGDLVGTLSALRKTGTLTLQAPTSMFVFEFKAGVIVHAVTNHPSPDLRLGTILVAQNLLTEQALKASVAASAINHEMLGAHLVRSQTVTEKDLRSALATQVQRIFQHAFVLANTRFAFVEGNLSQIAQRANLNTMQMLLEAARAADEAERDGTPPSLTRAAIDAILPG